MHQCIFSVFHGIAILWYRKARHPNGQNHLCGLFPTASIRRNYKSALLHLKDPDFLYVRRSVADRSYVNFWKKIKEKYPDCKIIIAACQFFYWFRWSFFPQNVYNIPFSCIFLIGCFINDPLNFSSFQFSVQLFEIIVQIVITIHSTKHNMTLQMNGRCKNMYVKKQIFYPPLSAKK